MPENTFEIENTALYRRICGHNDRNVRKLEKLMNVEIIPRGNLLIVRSEKEGDEAALKALHLISDFLNMKDPSYELSEFDLKYLARSVMSGNGIKADDLNRLKVVIPDTGRIIVPRTINQADYMTAIHEKAVTFSIGPAGTGKTYLAVVEALNFFLRGMVERIILTRPAVEAGENLGYLPGDLIQKINPYLRPLYDALFDLLPYEKVSKLIERGSIEIAPLAYMRGRTLNNAIIILDEAQNTTMSQMKMFLTRLGENSKMVISGDVTQIDLEKPKHSGLIHAMKLLKNITEIGFIRFTREDISRHPIVEKIVEAYEQKGYTD